MVLKFLKIDIYKIIKSKIIWLHIITPIITIIIFLAYFKISKLDRIYKIILYSNVICLAFPIIISIIMQFMYEQEEEMKFQYFLSCPTNKYVPHISKLLILIVLGFISTAIAFLGLGAFGGNGFVIEFYFKLAIIVFFSSIILYIFQYFIVLSLGKGANIGIGIVGSLMCALMQTGLGDRIWRIIPWDYGIRLSSYFITGLNKEVVQKSLYEIITVYLVILMVYGIIFIKKWEGRKFDD